MTSIEQYRAAIGRFYGRASYTSKLKTTSPDQLIRTFLNDAVRKHMKNPGLSLQMTARGAEVIQTLLTIGNVEKNPGPGDGKGDV